MPNQRSRSSPSNLEYVSDEWITENSLVIEKGLKTEMTESFLSGMKSLFEEHYVTIPEEKYDVLESMVEKLDDMETKLNEQIEKNVSLNKRLAESVAEGILDQVSEGLADTQKDKLASLAESVEFESEEAYREKLETLREAYFPTRGVSPSAKTETLSEGVSVAHESVSGSMAAYLKTLSSFSK
jgi:exonuclease VII large subunit